MKGAFVGVMKEQFNYWLMFEFKVSGYKRNMHKWLQCNIRSMNGKAGTEIPAHAIELQQHHDADSSTKLYRKLHFCCQQAQGRLSTNYYLILLSHT
jgi:hypothetical protein